MRGDFRPCAHARFVIEITKVQNRPDNMPILDDAGADPTTAAGSAPTTIEGKKDR